MTSLAKAERFFKIEATENDFIFFLEAPPTDTQSLAQKIQALCHRHRGVGADGVVFLYQKDSIWRWDFYNQDGSSAAVCGNAARCAAALLSHSGESVLSWQGVPGIFSAQKIKENEFSVSWPIPSGKPLEVAPELMDEVTALNDFGLAGVYWINSGVPHLVLLNHDIWSEEHRITNSPQLRAHPSLGTEGANITWVSLKNNSAVTFERGVEAETRSCGSGALAAFSALCLHRKQSNPDDQTHQWSFQFPGGILSVQKTTVGEPKLWLSGNANIAFEGFVHPRYSLFSKK